MNDPLQFSLTHRHAGLRSLGYFWLIVVTAIAGGAGLLQYSYVPIMPPVSEPSSADAAINPTRTAVPSWASWTGLVRKSLPTLLAAATPPAALPAAMDDRDPAANAFIGSSISALAIPTPGSVEIHPAAPPSSNPSPAASGALARMMLQRADALLQHGDVSAARLLYARAAAAGSGQAATAMGKTFDPLFLAEIGAVGLSADPALADIWYHRALSLGDNEARARLQSLTPPAILIQRN